MKIDFRIGGERRQIQRGEGYIATPKDVYRDAPESLLKSLLASARMGKSWKGLIENVVRPRNGWLADIILSEKRNAFLRLVEEFKEGAVGLDIGAGWGQHTVEMAKICAVCSIEPSPERFAMMRLICEQEGVEKSCFFINASLLQLQFDKCFDFATCIGVLEWVGKFEDDSHPKEAQLRFLKIIRSGLKLGAPLVVGIENRIGLKYLLGSNDDHIGKPHVMCMDYESARKRWREIDGGDLRVCTYTVREYLDLFHEAGFFDLTFYAALPDYKMPEEIIECYPNDHFGEYLKNGGFIPERDGSNGTDHGLNSQLRSLYKTLAEEKVAPLFAPSYFIVAR